MSEETLLLKIKTLETQLAVLKGQMKHLGVSTPSRSFADLYGIFQGKANSSEEEIEAAHYNLKWEDEEEGGIDT